MKRAILLFTLALAGCDPYANNLTGNIRVNVITAANGVPCIMAVGGGQGGLALSCDWSNRRGQQVPR